MLLTPYTRRAQITASSATQVQFAAGSLTYRPIKLGAPSGRIASLTALPAAATISGLAETKYLFAELAAPSGTSWSGFLALLTGFPWNLANLGAALHLLLSDDGALAYAAQNSVVTFVVSASATPATSHQIPLGEVVWDGAAITSLTSYEGEINVTVTAFIHGQCRLIKSGTDLKLIPWDGTSLVINGTARAVPTAGVTLAATGLTPGTLYFLYASWSGSAIVLEASTTGHATHTDGVEIKSADATRSYVGEWYVETGPAWAANQVTGISRFHPEVDSPRVLLRSAGNPFKDVVSTAAETSIFAAAPTIKGGTLGTDRILRIRIGGDILMNVASGGFILRFKYGGTTVGTYDSATDYTQSATRAGWWAEEFIIALGATNAQYARGHHSPSSAPGVTGGATGGGSLGEASTHTTVAIDSTVDKTLDITIQPSTSSASLSIRVFSVLAEVL